MIKTKPKTLNLKKSFFNWRTLWQIRYRIYALIVIFISTPLLVSTSKNIPEEISIDGFGYQAFSSNWLFQDIKKTSPVIITNTSSIKVVAKYIIEGDKILVYDIDGNLIQTYPKDTDLIDLNGLKRLPSVTVVDNNQSTQNQTQLEPVAKNLDQIYVGSTNPQLANLLIYEKYGIRTPVVWSSLNDLFETDPDGSVNQSKPKDTSNINSPIQQLLKDGIVHLAYSPLPGERSQTMSSYIVGHSSNYSYIKSAYNTIFRPIQERSQPGEEFVIYDAKGRQLKFRVFEAIKIADDDVKQAYKSYGNRRVVTLQTSVLGIRNGRWEATHRWLTRGELINPSTNQPYLE